MYEFAEHWSTAIQEPKAMLSNTYFTAFLIQLLNAVVEKLNQKIFQTPTSARNEPTRPTLKKLSNLLTSAQEKFNEFSLLPKKFVMTEEQAQSCLLDVYAVRDVVVRENGEIKNRLYYQAVEICFKPLIARLQILSFPIDHFLSSFMFTTTTAM